MKETEIETLLNELFPNPDLDFQVACQEPYLQVVANYHPTLSFDRIKILDTIQEALREWELPEVKFLALYTREMGKRESDWTICVDVSVADHGEDDEDAEETAIDAVTNAFGELDPELTSPGTVSQDEFQTQSIPTQYTPYTSEPPPDFSEHVTLIQQSRESRPFSSISQPTSSTPLKKKSWSRSKSITISLIGTAGISLICGFLGSAVANRVNQSESVFIDAPVGWYLSSGMLFGLVIGLIIAVGAGTRPLVSFFKFAIAVMASVSFVGLFIFPTLEGRLSFDLLVLIGMILGFSGAALVRYGSGRILGSGLAGLLEGVFSIEALVALLAIIIAFSLGWQLGNGPPPDQWFLEEEPLQSAVWLFTALSNL